MSALPIIKITLISMILVPHIPFPIKIPIIIGENTEDTPHGLANLCFSFRIGGDLDREAERGDHAEEGDVRVADLPRCGGGPGGV